MSRAQASFEYLAVLALTLVIIVPSIYLFYNYSKQSKEEVTDSQTISIGKQIIDNARFVHYSGRDSKITLDIEIPEDVETISVQGGKELVFDLTTSAGNTQLVFFSEIVDLEMYVDPLNIGSLEKPTGTLKLEIKAVEDIVTGEDIVNLVKI